VKESLGVAVDGLARRAVRGLAAGIFVAICAAGPVTKVLLPPARTNAVVALPELALENLLEGSFMKALERSLREVCPLTPLVRGLYCERLHELGWLDAPTVARGSDSWLFLREELAFDAPRFASESLLRKQVFELLQRRLDRKGVRVLVAIVPDKARIQRDRLGTLVYPSSREALTARLAQELRAAGFAVLDLAGTLAGHAKESVWRARDTHWNGAGMTYAAQAVAAEISGLGWAGSAGPEEVLVPLTATTEGVLGDLVLQLGVRPQSTVARSLGEPREGYAVALPGGGGVLPARQPQAKVALAGTSYSEQGFDSLLALALARRVDTGSVHVAWPPVRCAIEALVRIESGELDPGVLVWEFPERLVLSEVWSERQAQLSVR